MLRQEVAVLRRQHPGRKLDWAQRVVLAVLARLLSPPQRAARLVTPVMLLTWHRLPLRWRWTYPHRGGRAPVDARVAELIGQVARDHRAGAISGSRVRCSAWATGSVPPRSGGYSVSMTRRPPQRGGKDHTVPAAGDLA